MHLKKSKYKSRNQDLMRALEVKKFQNNALCRLRLLVVLGSSALVSACAVSLEDINCIGKGIAKSILDVQMSVHENIVRSSVEKRCKRTDYGSSTHFTLTPNYFPAGGTVTATACYPVETSGTVMVVERRILILPSGEEVEIKKETISRAPGFWKSTIEFTVPDNSNAGLYKLKQEIKIGRQYFTNTKQFTVTEKYQKSC